MACKAIIFAVGIYYMEDAIYLLKKYTCNLHEAFLHHNSRKHKAVIIRKIGSFATWIHAPRFNVALKEEIKGWSSSGEYGCKNDVTCDDGLSESPNNTVQLENRIEELEKELLRLQMQVSNILLKNGSKEIENCSDNDGDVVTSTSSTLPPTPPPLPPPPPPMPPTPLVHNKTPLVKAVPKQVNVKKDSTCTIMEELAKKPPKLRHVERSPGGRPIRITHPPTDPADVLAAVLRKRFEAIHGEKRECYMLSSEVSTKSPMISGH